MSTVTYADVKAIKRRSSKAKRNREEIAAALAAHDQIMAEANEIRARSVNYGAAGWGETGKFWANWDKPLSPLEDSHIVEAWRAQVAGFKPKGKPAKKRAAVSRPKRSAKVPASDPFPTSTPAAEVGRIELTPAIAFRLSGAELRQLASGNGPSEIAMIEIQRRKDLRREKVAA